MSLNKPVFFPKKYDFKANKFNTNSSILILMVLSI